jgi:D-alanine-D-alanine ligase
MKSKILIIFNGADQSSRKSGGWEADEETEKVAYKISKTLKKSGYQTELKKIEINNIDNDANQLPTDKVIFNYCEWTGNNYLAEVELLKIIAQRNLVYTGCSWQDHEWALDKGRMKFKFSEAGMPILPSVTYSGDAAVIEKGINFPAIVKTSREHCSIGLDEDSVVYDRKSAQIKAKEVYEKYNQPVILEEFAEGNEYQVFVFETNKGMVTLPVYETVYHPAEKPVLMTYADNWLQTDFEKKVKSIGVLNNIDKDEQLRQMAEGYFHKLKMRGYVRFDLREKSGRIFVLEVNPNPAIGWTDEYDFIRVCAQAAGMKYEDILEMVISGARRGV